MKCLIVDDEPLAIQLLESYVARIDGLVLVKSCANAIEALTTLHQKPVDLLFLDIQMPKITGIDLLKSLKIRPQVILTTAYREYAYEAFDLDVVDYLLKPILFERFLRAVGKVFPFNPPLEAAHPSLQLLHSYDEAYIYLREDREMVKVYLRDILFIESLRDYVRVKTAQRQIITYQKISYLEQKLPENKFVRIHRSFIVAVEQITSFTPAFVKIGNKEIPIGRNYKQSVMRTLQQFHV